MITIKYIPNILSQKGRITKDLAYSRNKSIKDFLIEAGIDYKNKKVIVLGKRIKDINNPVDDSDEIIVIPEVKGAVAAAVSTVVGWVATAVTAHPFISAFFAISTGYSIYQYINRPRLPNFGAGEGIDEGSPTYGWDGIRTIQQIGTPIPIIYGEHRVGGNVINRYISTNGDKHYLNLLLALCEGEIEGISTIKINGQPSSNFDGITTYTRYGTNSQSVIPNFEDLHNVYTINTELTKNDAYTYTTNNSDVEAFEIYFRLPNGLFQQDSSGKIETWSVTYKVEYKLHTDSTWTDLGTTTISGKSRTILRRIYRKDGLTAGQYDLRITKTSDDSSLDPVKTGDLYLYQIDEIQTDDLSYPNTVLLGIKALATEQLSGATPNITCIVKGKKISAPKIMNGAVQADWEDYYWDDNSQQYKLLSDDTVLSWDGSTYVEQYCANPVWCLKDLLLNDRYGLGEFIDTDNLTDSVFLEMSKYCEEKISDGDGGYEKRFRIDVVIDSSTKALDLIVQLCSVFNAMPVYTAGGITIKVDKETTPTQLFGMGNIVKNSFIQSWKSIKDVPNVIEIQYLDKDKDYKQETIAYIDETALAAGDPMRKKQIRLFVTRTSYAIRAARYALKAAKYINRTVSFKVGIDAIACQAGDVISISHDVPQWGFSGRVQSGSTTTSVVLDKEVTIESDKTYKVRVRFSDDTIEERTVSDGAGNYTTINVSSAFSQTPQSYDIYAFGEDTKVKKDFRVVSIIKENSDEVLITAIEYNENIYDDSAITLPQNNYSALNDVIPDVENLSLTEHLVKLADGTIENAIDVWFTIPDQTDYYLKKYVKAKIYLSEDNGSSWEYKGECTTEHFVILGGIETGETYYIAVVSASEKEENAIASSPQDNITIQGKTAPPSNVTGFDIAQQNDMLRFSWDAITDVDLARYVIKKGSEWNTGTVIAELVDTTEFMYPVGAIGEQTFMIKAVDTSGNESTAPAIDTITVTRPPDMNFLNDYDIWAQNLEYKLSNLEIIYRNDYNFGYVRPVLGLKTSTTWEERESEGQTWEYQESNNGLILDRPVESSGYFEMAVPIDLGTIFEFNIIIDADYTNIDGGSIETQISYSEDGSSYTSFAAINASTIYRARYIKFKFVLSTTNINFNVYFYGCTIFVNAPVTKLDYGRDVAIPVAGKTINFGVEFTYSPRVNVTIVNGVIGFPVVDNKSTTECEISVYDKDGAAIGTAEVDWDAKGY